MMIASTKRDWNNNSFRHTLLLLVIVMVICRDLTAHEIYIFRIHIRGGIARIDQTGGEKILVSSFVALQYQYIYP